MSVLVEQPPMLAAIPAAQPSVGLLRGPCPQTKVVGHLGAMEATRTSPHAVQPTPMVPPRGTLRERVRRRRKMTRAISQVMMTTTSHWDLDGVA